MQTDVPHLQHWFNQQPPLHELLLHRRSIGQPPDQCTVLQLQGLTSLQEASFYISEWQPGEACRKVLALAGMCTYDMPHVCNLCFNLPARLDHTNKLAKQMIQVYW